MEKASPHYPVLLDTGTQVSLLDSNFLLTNYPYVKVQRLNSILNDCYSFQIQWVNTTNIPFEKWVKMEVEVGEVKKIEQIKVPFLVTSKKLRQPILRFN